MKKFDKSKITYFALGAILVFLFLFFSYARVFDELELITLDFRYKLRPPLKVVDDIVIVEIGDDSIEKLEKWPFPRNYHALLVKALDSAAAKTIIFDIFFSESKKEDEEFARAAREAGNVYMPYVFDLERHNPDRSCMHASKYAASLLEILAKASKGTGFINVEPDEDGKVRNIPAVINYKGVLYPHITFLAALNDLGYSFDGVDIIKSKKIIAGGDLTVPLDELSNILVNYPAKWGKAFRHYSYIDILQSYLSDVTGREPAVDLSELKGAVCFIGLTATAAPDVHPSPFEPLYPGVGVHASVYNSMMIKKFLFRLNRWWNLLILVFMWVLTAFITAKSRKRFAFISIFLIMITFLSASVLAFIFAGVWIDLFYPLFTVVAVYITFTFRKYIAEIQRRELLEKELDIARDIQRSFLPQEVPQVGNLEIAVNMITARQVGGDLYDIVRLDDDKMGVMIGDVSGKGVPAALYMARVVSDFKIFLKEEGASRVVKKVNDQLVAESGSSNLFVTLTYMIFDTKTKKARMAIGGHLPTVLIKPNGDVGLLDVEEGMPLGLIEGDFSEGEIDIEPGSTYIFYTDGVTEAMDPSDQMFGQERLVDLAGKMKGRPASEVVDSVHKAVADFAGKAPQHDDITVLVVKT